MNDKLAAELLLTMKRLITLLEGQSPSIAPSSDEEWLSAADAYEVLKSRKLKSSAMLKRLRLEGVLSESRGEIRNVSQSEQPRWEYNIPKCREALRAYFDRLSA